MENYEKLIQQVQEYKTTVTTYEDKHDCFMTDLYLQQYKQEFQNIIEKNKRNVLKSIHHSGVYTPRVFKFPQLFHEKKPILTLFAYNITNYPREQYLKEYFEKQELQDFSIMKIKSVNKKTTLIIECNNLISSCLFQIRSCLNKFLWQTSVKKCTYVRVVPACKQLSQEMFQEVYPEGPQDECIPLALQMILKTNIVLAELVQYLSSEDFFNFYVACYCNNSLRNQKVIFDSSISRYQTRKYGQTMLSDAKIFRFNSIIFNQNTVDSPLVVKFLQCHTKQFVKGNVPLKVQEIDLRSVNVTKEIITEIDAKFSVKIIRLGLTRDLLDNDFELKNLEELEINTTPNVRSNFLRHENFKNLRVLSLINCSKLRIAYLYNFVRSNQCLQKLSIVNCSNITTAYSRLDPHMNIWKMIEAIFSGKNVIQSCTFTFQENAQFENMDQGLQITTNEHMTHLNISHNLYFKPILIETLFSLPNLQNLNIDGLLEQEQLLNLEHLTKLRSLTINYNNNLQTILQSTRYLALTYVEVFNRLGKTKTKVLSLRFINYMMRNNDIKVILHKCKICEYEVNYFRRKGALINNEKNYFSLKIREM